MEKQTTQDYLIRLKEMYRGYNDQDSLMALAEIDELAERARTLKIYREQPKTIELINAALARYRSCLQIISNYELNKEMSDMERAYCFAAMDWAKFTLDIVGETPERADQAVEDLVRHYAAKSGLIHS